MKLPLFLLLAQSAQPHCATELTLRGIGYSLARLVAPYVACINSTAGTEPQIRSACASARARAIAQELPPEARRAVAWLDAMIRERAACETYLKVDA